MAVVTEFKWKLNDFSQRFIDDYEDEEAWSEVFSLKAKPEAEFSVSISDYDDVCLYCDEIGQTGELNLVSKFWLESGGNKFLERESGFYSDSFLMDSDLADLQKFIVGDSVTICFNIKIGDSVSEFEKYESEGIDAFMENIGEMHSEGHHDLIIQADGKEFKAYKSILMGHSKIFKVMLSSPNSTEAQQNLIKIENTGADVIEALVNWMHFLKVENLKEIACELYKAAHKYDIAPLMKRCIRAMTSNLTVENLPSLVILAYIYEVDELKSAILSFVEKDRGNLRALMTSDEWNNILSENRELAKKIVDELCK